MEFVGILPVPDHSLPSRWFRLFGVLATSEDLPRESETCHFCVADIARDERVVASWCTLRVLGAGYSFPRLKTITSRHAVRTVDRTMLTWISVFSACVLSRPKNNSTVHSACVNLLRSQTLEMGESVHIECGGWATLCACHWIGV